MPDTPASTGYKLPDLSVGDPDGPNPFEKFTFAEMLEMSERELSMFPDADDEDSAQGAGWG